MPEKPFGEKKAKKGAQLFRISRVCGGAGTWRKVDLLFVKVWDLNASGRKVLDHQVA